VFAGGEFVTLALVRTADSNRASVHLTGSAIRADIPSPVTGAEYRLTVENLPAGYSVKSMMFGSTDLRTDTLKLNNSNFSQLQNLPTHLLRELSLSGTAALRSTHRHFGPIPSVSTAGGSVYQRHRKLPGRDHARGTAGFAAAGAGARISGKMPFQSGEWAIYSDNDPGILFADGSFEIWGVTPGRHILTMQSFGNPPQYYSALVNIATRMLPV
jgi:hypothetical protein